MSYLHIPENWVAPRTNPNSLLIAAEESLLIVLNWVSEEKFVAIKLSIWLTRQHQGESWSIDKNKIYYNKIYRVQYKHRESVKECF